MKIYVKSWYQAKYHTRLVKMRVPLLMESHLWVLSCRIRDTFTARLIMLYWSRQLVAISSTIFESKGCNSYSSVVLKLCDIGSVRNQNNDLFPQRYVYVYVCASLSLSLSLSVSFLFLHLLYLFSSLLSVWNFGNNYDEKCYWKALKVSIMKK